MSKNQGMAFKKLIERHGNTVSMDVLAMALSADDEIGKWIVPPFVHYRDYKIEGDNFITCGVTVPYDDFEDYHDILQKANLKKAIVSAIQSSAAPMIEAYYGPILFTFRYNPNELLLEISAVIDVLEETISEYYKIYDDIDAGDLVQGEYDLMKQLDFEAIFEVMDTIMYRLNEPLEDSLQFNTVMTNFINLLEETGKDITVGDTEFSFDNRSETLLVKHNGVTHICDGRRDSQEIYRQYPETPMYEVFHDKITVMGYILLEQWYAYLLPRYEEECSVYEHREGHFSTKPKHQVNNRDWD